MDTIGVTDAVIGGVIVAGLGVAGVWGRNQLSRKRSFAIRSALVKHIPESNPSHTLLVIDVDGSNTSVSPKLSSVEIVTPNGEPAGSTFYGSDAVRLRDGSITLSDLANDTLRLEVLKDNVSGVYDIAGHSVLLRAGRSALLTRLVEAATPSL